MRKTLLLLTIVLGIGLIPRSEALTIKLGSVAPIGSPWHVALQRLGAEWARISDGEVRLKLYMGGVAGNEPDMLRKMRIGQLHGAAITALGLNRITPEVLALSVPFLIRSEEELDYVMDKTRSYFASGIEEKGFRVLALSKAGWVHFFGRDPIYTPDDLKRQRLSVTAEDAQLLEAWRKLGFSAVPLSVPDLMMGLQSGMIDALYAPPLIAAGYQWFGVANHMCTLRVAPVVGGMILSERAWARVPQRYRAELLEAVNRIGEQYYQETKALEEEALRVMLDHGLQLNEVSPRQQALWEEQMAEGFELVVGKSFSRETYQLITRHLDEYRSR